MLDDTSPVLANTDACRAYLRAAKVAGAKVKPTLEHAAICWPLPWRQFCMVARARGFKPVDASSTLIAVSKVRAVLAVTQLAPVQTVEAAVAAYPEALAWATAEKARQVEGGKRLRGSGHSPYGLALHRLGLQFAAVPANAVARALDVHGVKLSKANVEFGFLFTIARKLARLAPPAGMCPALRAALSIAIPAGRPNHPAVLAARAQQAAAIAAARESMEHPI